MSYFYATKGFPRMTLNISVLGPVAIATLTALCAANVASWSIKKEQPYGMV